MINAETTLCSVIGNPIRHSFSPAMHNAGYQKLGLNFAYNAFEVDNIKDAVAGIRALGIRGASVTIPHKVSVMKHLDHVDKNAVLIGAVNTIVNNKGILTGYNTDWVGAITALQEETVVSGKHIAIIGAGGAARAIVQGAINDNADVHIYARKINQAKTIADKIGGMPHSMQSIRQVGKADIIINTTPVGMHPHEGKSILPKEVLSPHHVVFDIVYNPKETTLIKDAVLKGCTIVYGYKMLLHQALDQFRLFTSHNPPVATMEHALLRELNI